MVDLPTTPETGLVEELRAKAWASTRHKARHRTPARTEDHVCWRGADALSAMGEELTYLKATTDVWRDRANQWAFLLAVMAACAVNPHSESRFIRKAKADARLQWERAEAAEARALSLEEQAKDDREGIVEAVTFNKLNPDLAEWKPGDIIDYLVSDITRAEAQLEGLKRALEADRAIVEAAHDLVMKPGGLRMTPSGTYIVEKADKSDPHYRLCAAFEARAALASLPQKDQGASTRKTMTMNLTPEEMVELEKLASAEPQGVWQLISALRADEGDTVSLLCDNPEGPPNNAIECNGAWTNWVDQRFEGETLTAALLAAYRARKAPPQTPVSGGEQVIRRAHEAVAFAPPERSDGGEG